MDVVDVDAVALNETFESDPNAVLLISMLAASARSGQHRYTYVYVRVYDTGTGREIEQLYASEAPAPSNVF